LAEARRLAADARGAGARGDPQTALELFDRAIALLDSGPRDVLLADVLRWKGTTYRDRGETYLAQQLYERSLEIATSSGFDAARGHALNCLGIIAQRRGDLDRAAAYYDDAAACADRIHDDELRGMTGQNRGVLANIRGDHDVAMARYTESLRERRGVFLGAEQPGDASRRQGPRHGGRGSVRSGLFDRRPARRQADAGTRAA
jgi:tetratricopeptide (TPR) repeat protein